MPGIAGRCADHKKSLTPEPARTRHSGIKRYTPVLQWLPAPDQLGDCFTAQTHLVAASHNSALLAGLQQGFDAMGIQLTQISTAGMYRLPSTPDDDIIKNLLNEIAAVEGPVDGFVYLSCDDEVVPAGLEEPLLFLFAKHMQRVMWPSQHGGRQCFVVSTSLDGQLGIGEDLTPRPQRGSVFGLLKSLRQEWPRVFCRAIDFASSLSVEQRIESLLAELQDPQEGLVEVGIDQSGRWTIDWQEDRVWM